MLFINNVLLPWYAYFHSAGGALPSIELPTQFWLAWGGVTGAWAIGRSVEKNSKIKGEQVAPLASILTGSK